jgi:RNA polymerase sigma-70 factor, ECF subfamily
MAAAIPAQLYDFDRTYLSALHKGDVATEHHLFSYFTPFVQRKLSKYLQSPELVEDAAQETFSRVLVAVQREERVRHPERFGAYVTAVCRNVALEMGRRENRFVALDEAQACRMESFRSPQSAAEATETCERVQKILASLPALDRQLLEAAYLQEDDRESMCRRFGVSAAYLRVLLHRAKRKFSARLLKEAGMGSRTASAV